MRVQDIFRNKDFQTEYDVDGNRIKNDKVDSGLTPPSIPHPNTTNVIIVNNPGGGGNSSQVDPEAGGMIAAAAIIFAKATAILGAIYCFYLACDRTIVRYNKDTSFKKALANDNKDDNYKNMKTKFKGITDTHDKNLLIKAISKRMENESGKSGFFPLFGSKPQSKTSKDLMNILNSSENTTEAKWAVLEQFWNVITDKKTHGSIAGQAKWTGRRYFQIIIDETEKFKKQEERQNIPTM